MKTEEYIIIILTVMEEQGVVSIEYASNSHEGNVTANIKDSQGRTVHHFSGLAQTDKGRLTASSDGWLPGTYVCTIEVEGIVKDSKNFAVRG